MVTIRNVPSPAIYAFGQPERIRFEQDDRIILDGPDDADWRPLQTNEDGHTRDDYADAYAAKTLEPIGLNLFESEHWETIDTSIIQRKPDDDEDREQPADKPERRRSDT